MAAFVVLDSSVRELYFPNIPEIPVFSVSSTRFSSIPASSVCFYYEESCQNTTCHYFSDVSFHCQDFNETRILFKIMFTQSYFKFVVRITNMFALDLFCSGFLFIFVSRILL